MKDLIDKAKCYLNGDLSYMEGISVFIQLSRNKHLVNHLSAKHTILRERKLKYELGKIIKHNEKNLKTKSSTLRSGTIQSVPVNADLKRSLQTRSVQTANHHRVSNNSIDFSSDPSDLSIISRIEQERRELYRKRGHQHGRLHETISDSNRKEIALQILDVQSSIDQLNRELKDARDGKIPSRFVKQSISAETYIQIKNLKYYIARYRRELDKVESIQRKEQLQKLIDQNQQKLNQLL
jgi:hypothetical protein